ncbi:MAG: serine/threonine protein kinase [Thermoguttaceae bacterium]
MLSKPVLISCHCGNTVPAVGDPLPKSVQCERCGRQITVPNVPPEMSHDDSMPFLTATVAGNVAAADETIFDTRRANYTPTQSSRPSRGTPPSSSPEDSASHSQVQGALAVGGAMAAIASLDQEGSSGLPKSKSRSRGSGGGGGGGYGSIGMSRLSGIDLAQRFTPASGATSPQVDDPHNAAIYGIHLIIRKHAKGGMGQIAVAYDQFLKREVALKELRPEVLDDLSVIHRFVSEAEITAQLEHPGIVPVHVLGLDAEGHPYYTMKLIRGRTLQEAIKDYHKNPDHATLLWLVRRLVAASQPISFAHARGVIHRDIKPANIMFGEHNETLVMDWGLAKVYRSDQSDASKAASTSHSGDEPSTFGFKVKGSLNQHGEDETSIVNSSDPFAGQLVTQQMDWPDILDAVDQITVVGTVVGTPAFMSPEQATPGSTQVGPQTDVYGMGAVLYTILTGRPPFTGKSGNEVLEKVRHQTPPPAKNIKKGIPSDLSAICEKAMVRDLTERYASIDEFSKDICRWLDDEPVTAVRWTFWRRFLFWERRWRAFIVGTVLTIACVAATAEFFWSYVAEITRDTKKIVTEMREPHNLLSESRARMSIIGSGLPCRLERVKTRDGDTLQLEAAGTGEATVLLTSPAADGTMWDFSRRRMVLLSLFPHKSATGKLTNFEVRLGCGGNYFRYSLPPEHVLVFGSDVWNQITIPLEPTLDEGAWCRDTIGTPTFTHIDWIELVFDTTGDIVVDVKDVVVED